MDSQILENTPEISYYNPSGPLEVTDDIYETPFIPFTLPKEEICSFCQTEIDDSPSIQCACCGNKSHMSCYQLNEEPPKDHEFFCFQCQQNELNRNLECIFDTAYKIEEELSVVGEKLKKISELSNFRNPAPFASLQDLNFYQELENKLKGFLSFAEAKWNTVNDKIEEISSFTQVDTLGNSPLQ